jgi:nitroimidazol reductase NimA-like FMN-containing flavoprotein (pyridoxamine 5'-phosphate oxidase superfamily)
MKLLARANVGRVGAHHGALPVILPVTFEVTPEGIVLRTRRGSTLATAADAAVVAFEVDQFDPIDHGGWSVMVVGLATAITAEADLLAARELPLRSWAADCTADHYVRISPELVTGRRIRGHGS